MIFFYSLMARSLIIFSLLIILNSSVKAQFTTAGDIAFTGYISGAGPESFSFVILKNIAAGTTLTFTDNGWNGTALGVTEFTCTWTAGSAIQAGREIVISGTAASTTMTAVFAGNGTSAGVVTGNMVSLPSSGDQVLAYIGLSTAPTFIAGIHMNQYSLDLAECGNTTTAGWDPVPGGSCPFGGNNSMIPPGLTGGSTALWIGIAGSGNTDFDNARFACSGDLSTPAQLRAAINNYTPGSNWTTQSGAPSFTLPASCSYLGLFPLPVKLESFTGKLNPDKTITLQWKATEQVDIKEYIVEESMDGSAFSHLGLLTAQNATAHTYSYIDMQVAPGKNYYRLKIVELSGNINYSSTIMVNMKSGVIVMLYPNPVTDKLTIQQFVTIQNKIAVLSDGQGRALKQIKLTSLQQTVNMETYPAGIYILTMEDGTVFKVLKQ